MNRRIVGPRLLPMVVPSTDRLGRAQPIDRPSTTSAAASPLTECESQAETSETPRLRPVPELEGPVSAGAAERTTTRRLKLWTAAPLASNLRSYCMRRLLALADVLAVVASTAICVLLEGLFRFRRRPRIR